MARDCRRHFNRVVALEESVYCSILFFTKSILARVLTFEMSRIDEVSFSFTRKRESVESKSLTTWNGYLNVCNFFRVDALLVI